MFTIETETLTGTIYNSQHNGMEVNDYLTRLINNDNDRGNKELLQAQMQSITAKLSAEPTILAEVEATVDSKIAEAVAERAEAAVKEAEVLKEG